MKKGKKVNTERKFFPGYMLLKMIMDDEIWHVVRKLPKVYGFLGGKKGEPIYSLSIRNRLNLESNERWT